MHHRLDTQKDEFWESIDAHLKTLAPDEHVLLGGNLNGHVGQERARYTQNHGGCGLGIRNNEGCCILDCAVARDLVVANTFFSKAAAKNCRYQDLYAQLDSPEGVNMVYRLARQRSPTTDPCRTSATLRRSSMLSTKSYGIHQPSCNNGQTTSPESVMKNSHIHPYQAQRPSLG